MMSSVSKDSELNINPEFIESGKSLQHRYKKRGGPYSKQERLKRQDEVHRLHFEYGYSAKRISEMMNINRNTINSDIDHWYAKIILSSNHIDPGQSVAINIQRFNIQRSRLRESLDKVENFQQRLAIEKMIFDIDCKIINTRLKLVDSLKQVHEQSTVFINKCLKKRGLDDRAISYFDMISMSAKAQEKISKIINNDRDQSRIKIIY